MEQSSINKYVLYLTSQMAITRLCSLLNCTHYTNMNKPKGCGSAF